MLKGQVRWVSSFPRKSREKEGASAVLRVLLGEVKKDIRMSSLRAKLK